jgi:hypothetical protein
LDETKERDPAYKRWLQPEAAVQRQYRVALLYSKKEKVQRTAGSEIPHSRMIIPAQVLTHIQQKGQRQIYNNGRPKCQKRGVNEEHPDTAGRNSHDLPESGADPKCMFFKK